MTTKKRPAGDADEGMQPMPTSRLLGTPAWKPDFLDLDQIIEYIGSISHAYTLGYIADTETFKALTDAAHKAGSLLVKRSAVESERDLLEDVIRKGIEQGTVVEMGVGADPDEDGQERVN